MSDIDRLTEDELTRHKDDSRTVKRLCRMLGCEPDELEERVSRMADQHGRMWERMRRRARMNPSRFAYPVEGGER